MAQELAQPPLSEQSWFKEFLESRGFQRTAPTCFTNGRATIRVEGSVLHAIPGDGTKAWRSELNEAPPGAIRQLLMSVLAAPSFLSKSELDQRANRQRCAEEALQNIATSIREHPETHSGQNLRRFVWSMFNGHHVLNLWRLNDVLDNQHRGWVSEVFVAWMQGHVSETSLRRALTISGEMDRWDAVRMGGKELSRLSDAMDAVTDMLNATKPGNPMTQIQGADTLLRQAADLIGKTLKV